MVKKKVKPKLNHGSWEIIHAVRHGLHRYQDVSESAKFSLRTGRKINFFFPGSHLAPKYFKVVANSKKVVAMTHTQNHFYPVTVLDRLNCC